MTKLQFIDYEISIKYLRKNVDLNQSMIKFWQLINLCLLTCMCIWFQVSQDFYCVQLK